MVTIIMFKYVIEDFIVPFIFMFDLLGNVLAILSSIHTLFSSSFPAAMITVSTFKYMVEGFIVL